MRQGSCLSYLSVLNSWPSVRHIIYVKWLPTNSRHYIARISHNRMKMKRFHLLLSNPSPSCLMGIKVCDPRQQKQVGSLFLWNTVCQRYCDVQAYCFGNRPDPSINTLKYLQSKLLFPEHKRLWWQRQSKFLLASSFISNPLSAQTYTGGQRNPRKNTCILLQSMRQFKWELSKFLPSKSLNRSTPPAFGHQRVKTRLPTSKVTMGANKMTFWTWPPKPEKVCQTSDQLTKRSSCY